MKESVVSLREGETLKICTPVNVLNNKHTGGKLQYIYDIGDKLPAANICKQFGPRSGQTNVRLDLDPNCFV